MDVMAIREINEGMTYNAVNAVDRLCKNMKFFVLQTGTNVCTNWARNPSTDSARY